MVQVLLKSDQGLLILREKLQHVAMSFSSYYRANEVQQFRYSRPFRKGEKDPDNEFAVSPPPFPSKTR